MGAREVVAVEANTRAYLKCLVTKEILGIPSAKFLCGDGIRYLEDGLVRGAGKFDFCLASGVLYHFVNPLASRDEEYIRSREELSVKFPKASRMEYDGYQYTLHRQVYGSALDFKGFCGGSAASSAWMTKDDIFGAIEHFGFEVVDVGFEEQNHKGNGPCISIAARRRSTV